MRRERWTSGRLVAQAMLQVLQERWDPTFSEHSYGFRPGRSAHQAVAQAQRYIADGYNLVVDLDLEKFFDRVNHDNARPCAKLTLQPDSSCEISLWSAPGCRSAGSSRR